MTDVNQAIPALNKAEEPNAVPENPAIDLAPRMRIS
jgi:hypothetical protein